MPTHKDPLIAALLEGNSFVVTISDGGDLASIRAALKHGQILTFSPTTDTQEILIGDIVIVRWRGGNYMMHLVQEIQDQNFLIVNSVGGVNGWVPAEDIIGRASEIIDPAPRPSVPDMLDQLRDRYTTLIQKMDLEDSDADRLLSNSEDLSWYARQVRAARWAVLPRQNMWSYESSLWHLLKEMDTDLATGVYNRIEYYINHGKEHIGQLATGLRLLDEL